MSSTDIDIEALFNQAFVAAASSSRDADLTTEQKAQVASLLVNPQHPTADEVLAIRTLGFAGATQYKERIKQYLYGPAAWTTMYVLCRYWDMADEIIEQLRMIMRGAPWDDIAGNFQDLSFGVVGDYLADHQNDTRLGAFVNEILGDLMEMSSKESPANELAEDAKEKSQSMLRYMLDKNMIPAEFVAQVKELVTTEGE